MGIVVGEVGEWDFVDLWDVGGCVCEELLFCCFYVCYFLVEFFIVGDIWVMLLLCVVCLIVVLWVICFCL